VLTGECDATSGVLRVNSLEVFVRRREFIVEIVALTGWFGCGLSSVCHAGISSRREKGTTFTRKGNSQTLSFPTNAPAPVHQSTITTLVY
jgi:hypothetical protein